MTIGSDDNGIIVIKITQELLADLCHILSEGVHSDAPIESVIMGLIGAYEVVNNDRPVMIDCDGVGSVTASAESSEDGKGAVYFENLNKAH